MIIFSDFRDPIFNSREPNRVPETPLNNYNKDSLKLGRTRACSQYLQHEEI